MEAGAAVGIRDVAGLERALRERVDGEVRFDPAARGAYSTDASNYREVPVGVVLPRTVDAGEATLEVCREFGAPVLPRGAGTSLAGQATNTGVVVDWSKHCRALVSVDTDERTCVVEAGIVLDDLNARLRPHGLEFGPEPATHSHCTLGGMIGNNACGASAQRAGKVSDNVARLEVLLYGGTRMWVGPTSDAEYAAIVTGGGRRADVYRALRALRDAHLADIRPRFPDIPRRVSGYNLDALLPEQGFDLARLVVGSEGTLATVLRAELKLLPRVRERVLLVLAFPTVADAADLVPAILPHRPIALEGIDERVVLFQRERHVDRDALAALPPGGGYLLVQFGGDTEAEASAAVHALLRDLGKRPGDDDVGWFDDRRHEQAIWHVREAGLGATTRLPDGSFAWPGWEDAAVRPERLGGYLRDLTALYDEFGYPHQPFYGHFGHGCVHTHVPFDLLTTAGIAAYRSFMERAADLVVAYGGSLSGEHGDGQQRGELLARMFGDEVVAAFGRVKAVFDPDGRMNPGKLVAPRPMDVSLRLGTEYHHDAGRTHFAYPHDGGSFANAVLRCVGVGKCRRPSAGGVMCPSYLVTRDEEHATRGRARLLFEMLDGTARGGAVEGGWRSAAVRDALDLCLACKGCKAECPVNVDMATYKAEFLSHHYAGRLRPRSHYSMGWLPLWAALARTAPRAVNAVARAPRLSGAVKAAAGIDARRDVPAFAQEPFTSWFRRRRTAAVGTRGEVVLWPDTFTNRFHPHVARAAVAVLEEAGWRVRVPRGPVCCGLTWISTGQLATAKRVLRRTLRALGPDLAAGRLVVGLEPSCTAVFRADAPELLAGDEWVELLRQRTVTLAELLREHTPGWEPPRLGARAIVQTHCHQHAVMGFGPDRALLEAAGVEADVLDSGCCGLAGNFGFEQGHYEVSVACAERVLLPAVRDADAETLVVADGFSCRTQIEQAGVGARPLHLSELLAARRGQRA